MFHDEGLARFLPAVSAKEAVSRYCTTSNLIAVVSNGSTPQVRETPLLLGSAGSLHGKAAMYDYLAGIHVFNLELNSSDSDEIVRLCRLLEPMFGGFNLENIKPQKCFCIYKKLRESLSVPVFHDEQDGCAVVSGAALINGLEVAGKNINRARGVITGSGASAISCAAHYCHLGIRQENLKILEVSGIVYEGRRGASPSSKSTFAMKMEPCSLEQALKDADFLVSLSRNHCITEPMLKAMTANPVVLACGACELSYESAMRVRPDLIFASNDAEHPNHLTSLLATPYIFRGALDVAARCLHVEMKVAATRALADLAKEGAPAAGFRNARFGPTYLIPTIFDRRALIRVSTAVAEAAIRAGVGEFKAGLDEYGHQLACRSRRSSLCNPLDAILRRN